MSTSNRTPRHIIIVGNGFASLFFIAYFLDSPVCPALCRFVPRIRRSHTITVIGNGTFVYVPSIPELLVGKRTAQDITVHLMPFLQRRGIQFVRGRMTGLRDQGRTVITDIGTYTNDALFIGTGPSFRKDEIPGTRDYTYSPCYGPEDMERFIHRVGELREGIIYIGFAINRQDGFVAGRTGPMYECACLLDHALRTKGIRNRFDIHFFSPDRKPGEKGVLTDRLIERGIILDDGYEPTRFINGGMIDNLGTFRRADAVLYSPPMTGPDFTGIPVSKGGHIAVDRYGQVRGLHNVFAAGDCAAHEDPPPWVPHQAHMAQLRARAAARNMREVLLDAAPTHRYRYELSCILDMANDGLWMHVAADGKPPLWNLFPRRSRHLIHVKNAFERLFLFYLKHL
ncbi:MAG: NAD(P)/FAD-dependent oxidoreductase [Acidiferrobacteraceae bacterium]